MDPVKLKKRLKIGGEIERVNGKELSYSDFVENYVVKNRPVVLTGLMDDWRACKDWADENGRPNLEFLSGHFGNSRVQVADCYNREFADQKRVEMSVSEFVDYWLIHNEENRKSRSNDSADGCNTSLLYLKDWHFVKEYPEYEAYVTPLVFTDDWLNLYLDKYRMHNDPDYQERNEISCSDYRFVYMGPQGTWTPLHADVFRSYSWSANVSGTKLWLFLPPTQRHLVLDRNMKNSVYNILEDVDQSKFPGFEKAVWLECTQLKNEIIFVPSGWYHQVHNLEDAISINHNWFNGYNLDWVWNLLLEDYNEAKELIEDIRDISDNFEGLCQRNLAANTGMNFLDFFTFIIRMSFANLIQFFNVPRDCNSPASFSWVKHTVLNLMSIRRVAMEMNSTSLAEDSGVLLDIQQSIKDPAFQELCSSICRTFERIHEQCSHTYEDLISLKDPTFDNISMAEPLASNSKNLIRLIDGILDACRQQGLLIDEPRED